MKYALRVLARDKAFAAFAILTLALWNRGGHDDLLRCGRYITEAACLSGARAPLHGFGVSAQTVFDVPEAPGQRVSFPVVAGTVPVL